MPRYSLSRLAKLLQLTSKLNTPIHGICVDSRSVKPGELFFALKGERTDGHFFLEQVAAKGAAAAVVNHSFEREIPGLPLLRVRDVLKSLQQLTKKIVAERSAKIIAVTGSVGKTTTKEFIAHFLKSRFKVGVSPGNYNSQIGIPLSILNHTDGDEEVLILEMGMTQSGHIKNLTKIAPPDIAVITTTQLVHACNFNNLAEISRAKAEIFSHPKTVLGILPLDIESYKEVSLIGKCDKMSFSLDNPQADCHSAHSAEKFTIKTPKGMLELPYPPFPGRHILHNFMAAAIAAQAMGIPSEMIAQSVSTLKLPEMRNQIIEHKGIVFFKDCYNACSASVKAAIDVLPKPSKGGKTIAVLGEMVELGKFSETCHKEVGLYALEHIDHMLCFGKECLVIKNIWESAGKPVSWHMERLEIVKILKQIATPGDVVLLKGSRSKGVERVLEELDTLL